MYLGLKKGLHVVTHKETFPLVETFPLLWVFTGVFRSQSHKFQLVPCYLMYGQSTGENACMFYDIPVRSHCTTVIMHCNKSWSNYIHHLSELHGLRTAEPEGIQSLSPTSVKET